MTRTKAVETVNTSRKGTLAAAAAADEKATAALEKKCKKLLILNQFLMTN